MKAGVSALELSVEPTARQPFGRYGSFPLIKTIQRLDAGGIAGRRSCRTVGEMNVGTIPPVPSPASSHLVGGKVRYQPMPVGWGEGPLPLPTAGNSQLTG